MSRTRQALSKLASAPGRLARNTSAASRLSLVAVVVALVCLVVTSVVGLERGSHLAEQSRRDRLSTIGATRADEVERYVEGVRRAAIGQAISPRSADAIARFTAAYRDLGRERPAPADEAALADYYRDTVVPELEAVRGRPVDGAGLVPREPAAVHLQVSYVSSADGERGVITDAADGAEWSAVHGELHPAFTEFVIQNAVDDYYLIEPDEHTIVYSTAKDIDIGTSLLTGPHSGSALASVVNSFPRRPEPGTAVLADFTHYAAAGDAPSAFVVSPVVTDDVLRGFVALRIDSERLTAITTNDAMWTGLGDTGETYVVGEDGRMRSEARRFVEDRDGYLETVTAIGSATEDELREMDVLGTTVLAQQVPDDNVDAARAGRSDLVEATNYLGAEVLSSARALDIAGLDWVLIADVAVDELRTPIQDFLRRLLIAIAIFVVAVTFLAVRWSDRLLAPLRIISTRLRAVRSGGAVDPAAGLELPAESPQEFVDLAADIESMLSTLEHRSAEAERRADERGELLRRVVPAHVVDRAEAGEEDVLDHVTNATVAVILIRGLGELLRAGSADPARQLLDRFVSDADELAAEHGVDRIHLTGDAYFAACGSSHQHLDHARRSAAFALDVRDLVGDLCDEAGITISMSAGLDSGPLTVGLTGGPRLVYDAWGPAMHVADDLARRAGRGEVFASGATASLLPADVVTEHDSEAGGVVAVTGMLSDAGVSR